MKRAAQSCAAWMVQLSYFAVTGSFAMTRNYFRRFAMLLTVLALASVGVMAVSSADDGGWQATYWNNTELEGNPVLTRSERTLDYNWGDGSPAAGTVNADNFSARWTQTVNLQQGTWRFILSSDDGSRLLVNGQRVLDQWYDHSLRTTSAEIYLPGGNTQLTLEYFDRSHAAIASLRYDLLRAGGNSPQPTPIPTAVPVAQAQPQVQQAAQQVEAKPAQQAAVTSAPLTSTITSCSNVGYTANYYNNRNLSGTPVINRTDPSINFDWGNGAPAAGVNSDNFSVRWNGNVNLKSGSYLMAITGDDGLRLFINNTARVNDWIEQPLTTRTFNYEHAGGPLNIRVEHFEAAGYAKVGFSCVRLSDYTGPPRAQAQPVAQPVAQPAAQQQVQQPAPTPWPTAQPVAQPVAQPQPTAVPQPVAKAPAAPAPVPATASSCIISRVYRLNVRSGPGLDYAIETVVAYGDVVGLTGERQGKYLKIVTPGKQVGWINAYYCGSAELPQDNTTTAAPAPAPVAQPVAVAPEPVAPEPVVVAPAPIPVPAQTGCNEVTVTSEALMVRGGPDVENLWYDIAYGGQTLCLTGARNNAATWVEVITPNGVQGWVYCAWTTISSDQLYSLNPIQ